MQHAQFNAGEAREIVYAHRSLEGPLLPILHAVQARFGLVGEDAVRLIATELNLSRAEVHGVVSFYHDFRTVRAGRRVIKLCRAEACQAAGSARTSDAMERALDMRIGETSADGQVTLEAVYCLGLCAVAPAAMLDGRPIARLNEAKAGRVAEEARL